MQPASVVEAMRAQTSNNTNSRPQAKLSRGQPAGAAETTRANNGTQARPSQMQPTGAAEANQAAELKRGHHTCSPQAQRKPCERKRATKSNSRAQAGPSRMRSTGAAEAMRAQTSSSTSELKRGPRACGQTGAQRRLCERKRAAKQVSSREATTHAAR